jgi:hypothetical protein
MKSSVSPHEWDFIAAGMAARVPPYRLSPGSSFGVF